jgi:hypothetical protein
MICHSMQDEYQDKNAKIIFAKLLLKHCLKPVKLVKNAKIMINAQI